MMTFNIGPETIVAEHDLPAELLPYYDKLHIKDFLEDGIPPELTELLKKHSLTMTMNGMFYRTDKKGMIAKVVGDVFKQRKSEKGMMLEYEAELENVENEIKELEAMLEKME